MAYKAWAFIRRDFQTQSSYRLDFIMQIAGMLVSISLFYFISQVVGTAVNPYVQRYGADYFHFVLLGIAFYPFITSSSNNIAEAIHGYQQTGTLEMLYLGSTPLLAALNMSTLWNYCWTAAQSLFYLVAATVLFQARLNWDSILSALVIVLFAIGANTGLALINAGFVLVTKRTSPLARLLTLVTTLLAGVYYPIEVLPNWLQTLSHLLPATFAFDALRRVMLQGESFANVGADLVALVIFTIILLPIGIISFSYGLRWARIDGSLSEY